MDTKLKIPHEEIIWFPLREFNFLGGLLFKTFFKLRAHKHRSSLDNPGLSLLSLFILTVAENKSMHPLTPKVLCSHTKMTALLELPGGVVVNIRHFLLCSPGSVSGLGTETPQQGQKKPHMRLAM